MNFTRFSTLVSLFLSTPIFATSLNIQNSDIAAGLVKSGHDISESKIEVYLKSKTVDRINCTVTFKGQQDRKKVFKNENLFIGSRNTYKLGSWNFSLDIKVDNCEYIRPATKPSHYKKPNLESLNNSIKHILNYLENSQVKKTVGSSRFEGEWGSQMTVRKGLAFIGKKGYQAWDSNCFSTSAMYNILAPIYLQYNDLEQIPLMLNRAMIDIKDCKDGGTYNFWHKVSLPQKFKKSIEKNGIGLIRNPNNFVYGRYFIHAFSNVVNDSDDTSSAFISHLYQEKLAEVTDIIEPPEEELTDIEQYFDRYRDIERTARHPWDILKFRLKNTGAYLTWFGKEKKKTGIYLNTKKKHIPLEINDVDCVVNANILKLLAMSDKLSSAQGTAQTCKYLNKVASRKLTNNKCTLYYPNLYNIHFAFSEAYSAGVSCLEPSKNKLMNDIFNTQHTDGSWNSFKEHDDIMQSTIYAVNSVLNLDPQLEDSRSKETVERAMSFISQHTNSSTRQQLSLKGGIFFSGGSFAKNSIVWKSDAITTAYYLKALINIKSKIEKGEWK